MTVLVDTSAWYALLDAAEPNHRAARERLESLAARREPLVTHNYVVVETLALVQRRLGMPIVRDFAGALLPIADIEWIQPSLHDVAVESFVAGGRETSFVDHVSFALMRARRLAVAFAFDDDFREQGFALL